MAGLQPHPVRVIAVQPSLEIIAIAYRFVFCWPRLIHKSVEAADNGFNTWVEEHAGRIASSAMRFIDHAVRRRIKGSSSRLDLLAALIDVRYVWLNDASNLSMKQNRRGYAKNWTMRADWFCCIAPTSATRRRHRDRSRNRATERDLERGRGPSDLSCRWARKG